MQGLDRVLEEIDIKITQSMGRKREGLLEAENIIRKHMNDGWIPVEERMPEEYGEYLVTIVPSAGYLWAKRIIANFSDLMGIVKKPIFYTGEVGKLISKILPIWLSPGVLFQNRTFQKHKMKEKIMNQIGRETLERNLKGECKNE